MYKILKMNLVYIQLVLGGHENLGVCHQRRVMFRIKENNEEEVGNESRKFCL